MAPNSKRPRGLLLRGGVWHIDKVIYGTRVCRSTGTSNLVDAEALLARRVTEEREVHLFGKQRMRSFRDAAAKYLRETQGKRSLERDERAIAAVDPYIGDLPLQHVHHDTLQPYIRWR